MKRVYLLLLIIAITIGSNVNAQGVAVNATGADAVASSILDITSTSQGLLIPRMTEAERDAIDTPATGLLIYQTDETPGLYDFNGTSWNAIGNQGSTSTHGEMAEYNARGSSSPIPITTADTYYGWTSAGSIVQNGTSFVDNGTADRIEVLSAGNYLVQVSVSFGTAGLFPDYIDGAIFVNGSINNNLKFRRYVSAGDIGSASIVGIISLNATDYIDLRFTSNQSGDQVTISICNVTVVKLN